MGLHIGIDLGTSGCRAIAIDQDRHIVAEARTPLPPSQQPAVGHFEQNPADWWEATLRVLDELIPTLPNQSIETLCVDGTSATLLLSDHQGNPLTPALMYNDTRSTLEAEQLRNIIPQQSGAQGAGSSAAKLLYLTRKYKSINNKIHALHQADWISNRLCNRYPESDENNALKMGYDPQQRGWPTWIKQLDLPSDCLPRIGIPGRPYGKLTPQLCRRWNIDPSSNPVQICHGTTDSIASSLAAGIENYGDAVTTLGTTLVLKVVADSPIYSPEHGVYSHRLGDRWLISGASNAGGGVLLEHFTLEEINQLGLKIDPTHPSGLDYYPLSSIGERFPIADPDYLPRLSPRPDKPHHFLQGILEGLTQIELEGYRLMTRLGAPTPKRILSAGGGTKNQAWMALREQHSPWPTFKAQTPEAAFGAALLGQSRV
ncbi:MAG: FGGY-family carbohydrate kinase [Gammaproteobacteria bacterium]|nr:FGGY-family carbohydrate kinase [Gammaproteobacteria bacterium]